MEKAARQMTLTGHITEQLPDLSEATLHGSDMILRDSEGRVAIVRGENSIRHLRCMLTSQCQLWDRRDA